MRAIEVRKQMVRERIRVNRQLVAAETEALRARFGAAVVAARVGRDLLRPLAAVAGVAASALRDRPVARGGAVGLAALVPITLAVARIVGRFGEGRAGHGAGAGEGESGQAEAARESDTDDGDGGTRVQDPTSE